MRKEYKDRWTAPIVNLPVTMVDHDRERDRAREAELRRLDAIYKGLDRVYKSCESCGQSSLKHHSFCGGDNA
jgi:hypothetical protein